MPVQVYTSSPISASPPEGVAPKTAAGPQDGQDHAVSSPLTASPTSSTQQHGSHPAQPGARPHLPAQTDAPQTPEHSRYQPTRTQPDSSSPPPPQPGAVPSPVAGRSGPHPPPPPPPPKTGEAASSSSSSYQPHAPRYAYGARHSYTQANDGERTDYSHPPGYQQNAYAADFSSAQLAAHNASGQGAAAAASSSSASFGEEESVWDMAKKWATAAGNTLVVVENEIWKRINGD